MNSGSRILHPQNKLCGSSSAIAAPCLELAMLLLLLWIMLHARSDFGPEHPIAATWPCWPWLANKMALIQGYLGLNISSKEHAFCFPAAKEEDNIVIRWKFPRPARFLREHSRHAAFAMNINNMMTISHLLSSLPHARNTDRTSAAIVWATHWPRPSKTSLWIASDAQNAQQPGIATFSNASPAKKTSIVTRRKKCWRSCRLWPAFNDVYCPAVRLDSSMRRSLMNLSSPVMNAASNRVMYIRCRGMRGWLVKSTTSQGIWMRRRGSGLRQRRQNSSRSGADTASLARILFVRLLFTRMKGVTTCFVSWRPCSSFSNSVDSLCIGSHAGLRYQM